MPPTKHRGQKPSTTLSTTEHQIREQLVRERKLLRRLEEKERQRLEEGEWSDIGTTLLGKYAKIGGGALPLKKRHKTILQGTRLGKEGKTGVPSTMLKSLKKADAELLAHLEIIFNFTYFEKNW
jgi:hypothetical protein